MIPHLGEIVKIASSQIKSQLCESFKSFKVELDFDKRHWTLTDMVIADFRAVGWSMIDKPFTNRPNSPTKIPDLGSTSESLDSGKMLPKYGAKILVTQLTI